MPLTNPPQISAVDPSSGSIGGTVTISGDYFSVVPTNNTVTFEGVPEPSGVLLLSAAGSAAAAAGPPSAPTAADKQAARKAWLRGKRLFDAGDYAGALQQFARGHRLSGSGGFLFNMAECARLLGDKVNARELYRRYLREYASGSHRAQALARCEALKAGPCTPAPKKDKTKKAKDDGKPDEPGAAASADDKKKAASDAPSKAAVASAAPGPASAPATAASRPAFLPSTDSTTAGPAKRPLYKRWYFWASIGAAVAAGTVTAVALASS